MSGRGELLGPLADLLDTATAGAYNGSNGEHRQGRATSRGRGAPHQDDRAAAHRERTDPTPAREPKSEGNAQQLRATIGAGGMMRGAECSTENTGAVKQLTGNSAPRHGISLGKVNDSRGL